MAISAGPTEDHDADGIAMLHSIEYVRSLISEPHPVNPGKHPQQDARVRSPLLEKANNYYQTAHTMSLYASAALKYYIHKIQHEIYEI